MYSCPHGPHLIFFPQTGEGSLDKSQVCREEVSEEAVGQRSPSEWRAEITALEREDVPEARQQWQSPQIAPQAPARAWQCLPSHPLFRCLDPFAPV